VTDGERPGSEFERFFNASIDDLDAKPLNSASPSKLDDIIRRQRKEQLRKLRQANRLRKRFYRWTTRVAAAALFLNFAVFGLYMISEWGRLADAVMIAWISATVVEVLGIVAIVARYLFETDPSKPRDEDQSES
jgi:hypothetical protein